MFNYSDFHRVYNEIADKKKNGGRCDPKELKSYVEKEISSQMDYWKNYFDLLSSEFDPVKWEDTMFLDTSYILETPSDHLGIFYN